MQSPKFALETTDGRVATITESQARPMRAISAAFGCVFGKWDKCFDASTAVRRIFLIRKRANASSSISSFLNMHGPQPDQVVAAQRVPPPASVLSSLGDDLCGRRCPASVMLAAHSNAGDGSRAAEPTTVIRL